MSRDRKFKTSSLTHVLQIGKEESEEGINPYEEGYFDEQKNFIIEDRTFWPWEWVVIPEIVEVAKSCNIEIPENPDIDLSRTF